MSDAFDHLDEYFWSVNNDPEAQAPDEAFDWIFMMRPDDWALLTEAWQARPRGWREECAYVLGEGPVEECQPFLESAIFDVEFDVALQAGISLAALLLDQEGPVPPLQSGLCERLAMLRDLGSLPAENELSRLPDQVRS